MQLRHVVIRQGVTGVLVDLEAGVELEHFQELQRKRRGDSDRAFLRDI